VPATPLGLPGFSAVNKTAKRGLFAYTAAGVQRSAGEGIPNPRVTPSLGNHRGHLAIGVCHADTPYADPPTRSALPRPALPRRYGLAPLQANIARMVPIQAAAASKSTSRRLRTPLSSSIDRESMGTSSLLWSSNSRIGEAPTRKRNDRHMENFLP
jgi:hypothetical protein